MQRKRPGRLLDTVSVCLFPVPSCNSFVCVCVVVVVEVVEGTRFALLLRSLVLSLFFSLSSFLSEPVPLFLRILSLFFSPSVEGLGEPPFRLCPCSSARPPVAEWSCVFFCPPFGSGDAARHWL